MEPAPGTPKVIGRYQIEEEIGEGNWGKVRRATNTETGEQVAVKIFYRPKLQRKLKDGIQRLYAEHALVQSLDHAGVIKYGELFESGQKLYLVMGLGGKSLDDIVEHEPDRLTAGFIRSALRQLLGVLIYLDSQSVAHHDVKPANILVDDAGALVLGDFGVAERYNREAGCNSFYGTPAFQPPEIAGNVSGARFDGPKADVWSAGVLLYYLAVGRYPYHAETVYLLLKAIDEEPCSIPAGLDSALRDLLARMLEKDPAKRISAQECLAHAWCVSKDRSIRRRSAWQTLSGLFSRSPVTRAPASGSQ